MDFDVLVRTYDTYGSHSTLSLIPDFLLQNAIDFGPAIAELSMTFHFPHSGTPRKTLEELYSKFHSYRSSLPKVVFKRKKCLAEIDIASELIDAKKWNRARGLSLTLFNQAVPEAVAALSLLRRILTRKDDFNLEAFLVHCSKAKNRLPSTPDELIAFSEDCKKLRAIRHAAMSPWEKLGIDWNDFHPNARHILNDPFYWDCCDDFAPNGNDTGADLLEEYRTWFQQNPSADPITFYKQLIRRWGFDPDSPTELARSVMDEAAVALAFAEFKLRGDCRQAVTTLARMAIEHQRQEAIGATEWPHRTERLRSLDLLETKLLGG